MAVVSCCDVAEMLEFVDAAFDDIAFSVLPLGEWDVVDPV